MISCQPHRAEQSRATNTAVNIEYNFFLNYAWKKMVRLDFKGRLAMFGATCLGRCASCLWEGKINFMCPLKEQSKQIYWGSGAEVTSGLPLHSWRPEAVVVWVRWRSTSSLPRHLRGDGENVSLNNKLFKKMFNKHYNVRSCYWLPGPTKNVKPL